LKSVKRFLRRRVVLRTVCVLALTMIAPGDRAEGQVSAVDHSRGSNIAPAYEGWMQNPDGSFDLIFGYFNRNFDETLHVPIGPNNRFEPGDMDRGQPTYFLTRRAWFVFRVRVPKDFGDKELVWTLMVNGKTERAYATLKPDYVLDYSVIYHTNTGDPMTDKTEHNKAPVLDVAGPLERTARVSQPLLLTAMTSDDGIPAARPAPRKAGPFAATGLRLAWFVYRGDGRTVAFSPPQFDVQWNYRSANSVVTPGWTPPALPVDGKVEVKVTFSSPGVFVLRAMAHDGAFDTTKDVTVRVEP
jgi:hypothetical protein